MPEDAALIRGHGFHRIRILSELDGARAVGMHTVAFNYDAGANADYFIEKFSGLLNVPVLD